VHDAEGITGAGWTADMRRPAAVRAAVWVLAITAPALLILAALPLHSDLSRGGFQLSALVLVVTLAVAGGMRPALTALLLTMLGRALFFAPVFMTMAMTRMSAGRFGALMSRVGWAHVRFARWWLGSVQARLLGGASPAPSRRGRRSRRQRWCRTPPLKRPGSPANKNAPYLSLGICRVPPARGPLDERQALANHLTGISAQ
jgi:hypothetical protein